MVELHAKLYFDVLVEKIVVEKTYTQVCTVKYMWSFSDLEIVESQLIIYINNQLIKLYLNILF